MGAADHTSTGAPSEAHTPRVEGEGWLEAWKAAHPPSLAKRGDLPLGLGPQAVAEIDRLVLDLARQAGEATDIDTLKELSAVALRASAKFSKLNGLVEARWALLVGYYPG